MDEGSSHVGDSLGAVYQRLKRPILRRARRWFPTLTEADLEDVYQAAWLSVVRTEAEVRDLEDYVYAAVRSQGLMELRRRRRRPVVAFVDLALRGEVQPGDPGAGSALDEPVDETAVPLEERADARLMEAWARDLLQELSERQRSVVKLRWGWGLSRADIAGLLGVSEKTVKRELEVSGRRLSEDVEQLRAGRWCERRRSLITAYALELLSPARVAGAEAHLRACTACRGLVRELRRRAEDIAAVAPGPVLVEAPGRGPFAAIGDALDSARTQLSDLASASKHQAVSLSVRATDPTPLAGARPGALAAAVAGCLAVGTGAYCAVEGAVPGPLRFGPLSEQSASADERPRAPESAARDPDPPTLLAVPAPLQAPASAPEQGRPQPSPSPPAPAPSHPPRQPEPGQEFFGDELSTVPVAQSAGTEPKPPATSAPAPAAPRGEFDGP